MTDLSVMQERRVQRLRELLTPTQQHDLVEELLAGRMTLNGFPGNAISTVQNFYQKVVHSTGSNLMGRNLAKICEHRVLAGQILQEHFGIKTAKTLHGARAIGVVIDDSCTPDQQKDIYEQAAEQIYSSSNLNRIIPKEHAMLDIKHHTTVNGQHVTSLSNDEIFDLIARAEAEVARLKAIVQKPKKLEQKIDDLEAAIKQLGVIVDAR